MAAINSGSLMDLLFAFKCPKERKVTLDKEIFLGESRLGQSNGDGDALLRGENVWTIT